MGESKHDINIGDFFEMSVDNACVTGFDGYFRAVNPAWSRTLGWSSEELLSRPVLDFVHPDDRAGVIDARKALGDGETLEFLENRYACKDGSYRWLQWKSVADTGRGLIFATARDISQRKEAEEQLQASQAREQELRDQLVAVNRMASVGTLAAGVAHEINNPLTAVLTNLSLIRHDLEDTLALNFTDLRLMTDEAIESAQRIRDIVKDLSIFSNVGQASQVFGLSLLVEQTIAAMDDELRSRAQLVQSHEPAPRIGCNKSRLEQVLAHLLTNSLEAIPDHEPGELHVTVGTGEDGNAFVEIRDNGKGIPAGIVDRVYDPFFSTKSDSGSTGLGLYVCHSVIDQMNGTITIDSVEGEGTTVRVSLPPADEDENQRS